MSLWLLLGIPAIILLFVAYRVVMSPEMKYHSLWYKIKAKFIFWAGDVRTLDKFPWVTWASKGHVMTARESREASVECRPGDIGLHRDDGYLSNVGIPGAFKHAWVCVDDHYCVEALSEGVVKRDDLAPLFTDYAVILRPRGVLKEEVSKAMARTNALVGHPYDVNFKFNFEESSELVSEMLRDLKGEPTRNLRAGRVHMAFSCTEVAGFCWWFIRDKLRIFRSKHAGREAIIADDFLMMEFDIAWASDGITPEWMAMHGLHEEGRRKMAAYRHWQEVKNDRKGKQQAG